MHCALFYDIKHCSTLSPVSVATQYSCTIQVLQVTKLLNTETQDSQKMHNTVPTLTLRLVMSYIHGAPIFDVSRSHTMTHHSG